jgi:hypothetical protein
LLTLWPRTQLSQAYLLPLIITVIVAKPKWDDLTRLACDVGLINSALKAIVNNLSDKKKQRE